MALPFAADKAVAHVPSPLAHCHLFREVWACSECIMGGARRTDCITLFFQRLPGSDAWRKSFGRSP